MISEIQTDYMKFLDELGLTPEDMDRAKADVVYLPMSSFEGQRVIIADSDIEGMGVFSQVNMSPGTFVAPAFNARVWSCTGRFLNHSDSPNVVAARIGGITFFEACRMITIGEELTVDYRNVREVVGK